MIVIVDTNVWVSALHFGGVEGVPFRALSRASEIDTIATCDEMYAEIARVLEEASAGSRSARHWYSAVHLKDQFASRFTEPSRYVAIPMTTNFLNAQSAPARI